MPYFNIVSQSAESTVVTEYKPQSKRSEAYQSEADLEKEFIRLLCELGYERLTIHKEADLIANLRTQLEKLNNYRFTDGEWKRFWDEVLANTNSGILEKTRLIQEDYVQVLRRDNGESKNIQLIDKKCIHNNSLQVINQYAISTEEGAAHDNRYDVTVLVNGLPLIHIELKRRGVPIREAFNQIDRYQRDSFWASSGLYEFVQIFVISNGTNTKYYSNTTRFNHIKDAKAQKAKKSKTSNSFEFTSFWADANNRIIPDLVDFTKTFFCKHTILNILTRYCVFTAENMLLVMRPYQIVATERILNRIEIANNYKKYGTVAGGGYIWHTTGSGKTLTSFKTAQLATKLDYIDKVLFVVDRKDLDYQTMKEYDRFEKGAANSNTSTAVLKRQLEDDNAKIIITTIQKLATFIKKNAGHSIFDKRVVIIFDECHRSQFGDMHQAITKYFKKYNLFGFTGTPIQGENQKKMSTTATVFGNELHRYSIADGIRDHNVLGFDPYKVLTFKDSDLRKAVALEKAKAYSVDEALADPQKSKVFYKYLNLPMAGGKDALGEEIKGIEDYIPNTQYEGEEHQKAVVEDICENWQTQSRNSKFHAIFATSSIPEAIQYYKRFREAAPWLKVTALFDPNIDNNGKGITKEEGLKEIVEDYNARYGQDFRIPTFAKMKKDIAARLAHKLPYQRIERTPEKQLDLLIVVDQMLTGFDSKWINTLYLDKMLQYENLIQAFSRTNRLFGDDKQFGTIKYYRRPHTMEKNIADAVKEYSGDKPFGLFVDKLDKNVEKLNALYAEIKDLFVSAGIEEFSQIPADMAERKKFADLFQSFNENLEAAKVQGFEWDKPIVIIHEDTDEKTELHADFDERTFKVLALRYKEFFTPNPDGGENDPDDDVPYAVNSYLTTIDTADIDTDYMNSRFEKYLKIFYQEGAEAEAIHQAETELHKTFATLSQEEQKYANIFLHDIQSGAVVPQPGKTLREYIAEYIAQKQNDQIHKVAEVFGLDEKKLRAFMRANITEANINEFGRFDDLKATVDKAKAKAYFEAIEGTKLIPPKVPVKYDKFLREFIVSGGFDLKMPKES